MKIVLFYHSLLSDWNHGNAHFLRGYATELKERGHEVTIYEPSNNWSLKNLTEEHGETPVFQFTNAYPTLRSTFYDPASFDAESALKDADLVIVHEWNDPDLVAKIGHCRIRLGSFRLLFHDTHHRSVTAPESMSKFDLAHYDGVLAYGEAIRQVYLQRGWSERVWTWHEAADIRVFFPRERTDLEGDLVWIGNWGDEERTAELREFLLNPVRRSGIRARAYGVRYPKAAKRALSEAEIEYANWLPNFRVPEVLANFCVTVHIPRRPYVRQLPGIPTIRPFEAMACGIPLICSPWEDREGLFRPGDFLIAEDEQEMIDHLWTLLNDEEFAAETGARGRETILKRHTCAHRVDELLEITAELGIRATPTASAANLR